MKIYIAKADDDNGEVSFGKLEAREANLNYIIESIDEKSSQLLERQRKFIKKKEVDRPSDWYPVGAQFGSSKNAAVRGIIHRMSEEIELMQKDIEQLRYYAKKCDGQNFYTYRGLMFHVEMQINSWRYYNHKPKYKLDIVIFAPKETPKMYKCREVVISTSDDNIEVTSLFYKNWYWTKNKIDKPLDDCHTEGVYTTWKKAAEAIIEYCNTEIAILKYSIKKKERIIKQCEGFVVAA